jgi:hypothetical protein
MSTGLDLLNDTYQQLRNAHLVTSKADFSERLLARSRSYLTSMQARDRNVSEDILAALSSALGTEIRKRCSDYEVAERIVLRRAKWGIDVFLGSYPAPSFSAKVPLVAITLAGRMVSAPTFP